MPVVVYSCRLLYEASKKLMVYIFVLVATMDGSVFQLYPVAVRPPTLPRCTPF